MKSILCAILALLNIQRSVLGDGSMFVQMGTSGPLMESPAQQALLIHDRKHVTVILQTYFNQGPAELAWIVPVPGNVEWVKQGPENIFKELAIQTTPELFIRNENYRSMCGCSASEQPSPLPHVRVMQSGKAGIFDYATLDAKTPQVLVAWLKDNGYQIPESALAIFERYTRQNYT